MHVPDHYLDPTTSVVTGVIAVAGLTHAYVTMRHERPSDDRVPMAALVATAVFAGQMVNFPISDGTSGHLLGGALAAILVGPATAAICLTGVLLVQAVAFGDGGIAALGTNVTLMALVGVVAGWLAFRGALAMLPCSRFSVPLAAAVAGCLSVPASAMAFTGLFAFGGHATSSLGDIAMAMLGWHSVIGVVEGLITGLLIAVVLAVRPDLVLGADRHERRSVQVVG